MKIKLACLALFSLSTIVHAQTTIAGWSWSAVVNPAYNSPSATTGNGTASVLGMNLYSGSVANADVTEASKTTNVLGAAFGEYGWRIRGASTTGTGGAQPPNGWNSAAAIGTQGAEFAASTVGFNNINISFDLTATAQGEANMAVEYTTDGINWNVANLSYTANAYGYVANNLSVADGGSANTITGDYFHITSVGQGNFWFQDISIDLDGVTGVDNNPNFAVEVVNASTGADCINPKGTALNNTSGNDQIGNFNITGTPEPSAIALAGMGVAGLFAVYRRNRKA